MKQNEIFRLVLPLTLLVKHIFADVDLVQVEADRCTTIVVGPNAGTEGPMVTHTADCMNCDFRLNKVPAMDHEKDSKRTLYEYKGDYPATVTETRGKTWHPDNLEGSNEQKEEWGKESIITGYIPEVKHTYALWEAGYGIMNEHQVAIGESTCAAKLWATPTSAGGKASIEVREMSRIALERTKTARDAILLMGSLAEDLGFYAADWSGGGPSMGEGGEALTVIDKTEAWVFHVLADDTGTSAVWAAQKLEPDHVSVVANQFVIKEIKKNDDHFLYSSNIFDVAKRAGFWSEDEGDLNFVDAFSPPRAHPKYATRRAWRVLSLVAPSTNLPGETDMHASDYPFSVKAEKTLSPQDLMEIQRDHYEGTEYDMTKGIAAGPYGDPARFDPAPTDGLTLEEVLQGAYERAISMYRTSYSIVAVARDVPDELALLWFSQYAPHATSYVPMYVSAESAPKEYSHGTLFKYDSSVAFWNFCAVGNYAARFYMHTIGDIQKLQASLMEESIKMVARVDGEVRGMLNGAEYSEWPYKAAVEKITTATHEHAATVVGTWRDFFPHIITKYHDGYRAEGLATGVIQMNKLFYPKSWLDITGYWNNKAVTGEDVILFATGPNTQTSGFGTMFFTALISSFFTFLVGFYYVQSQKLLQRHEYVTIEV